MIGTILPVQNVRDVSEISMYGRKTWSSFVGVKRRLNFSMYDNEVFGRIQYNTIQYNTTNNQLDATMIVY